MKFVTAFILVLLATTPGIGRAETGADAAARFAELEKRTDGKIGVAAIDTTTNKRVVYRAEDRFLMCSTFKVLAAAAVLKRVDDGKEKLDRVLAYGEAQLLEYAPVTRAHVKEGGMTVEALCAAAIQQSDNTAANLLLETIGGPQGLTKFMRGLGDEFTRLDRMEPDLNIGAPGDERDTTTPAAIGASLQRLLTSDVLSGESRARLEAWMEGNQTGGKMIRASVPAGWRVGDKTGRGKSATNDIAILRPPTGGPIFMAIYTDAPKESSDGRQKLVADVAKIALEALAKRSLCSGGL